MKKARYLAAGIAALAKPFFLAGLAAGIQLSDGAQLSIPFLRYLLLPQAIPALCLFFLWYDESRYLAFRPLAALLALSSAALLVAAVFSAADNLQMLVLAVRNAQGLLRLLLCAAGTLAIDLLSLFVLLPDGGRKKQNPRDAGSVLHAAGASESATAIDSPSVSSHPDYKEP